MSWPLVKLSELVEINIGRTPSRSNDSYWGEGHPWLSIADMSQGSNLAQTKEQITELAVKETKPNLAPKGTVLFSFKLSIGKVGITDVDMYHNEAIASFPIKERSLLCTEYLVYALQSLDYLASTDRAVMGATLNKKKLAELLIPLPPLPVQKKIAAVLEKADTLRSQCQQIEQALNSLAQSVFLDMFGDPVSNSKNWPIKKFKDIGSSQLGKMLSEKSKQGVNPKRYLRNANVRWRKIELHDLLEMDFNEKEIKKFKLEHGDLLVCEGGDVGRCAIWRDELSDCYYQKALHRVRVNKDIVKPEYIQEYFYWMSKLGGLLSSVSEVTFSHLTAAKMAELKVPVPPIELQEGYIQKISVINESLKNIEESEAAYEQNFNSLMQRAFKGELDLKDVA